MADLVSINNRRNDLADVGFGGFQNMLDDFFAEGLPFGRSLMADTFKLDVHADEKAYYVEAELPGVKKEDRDRIADRKQKAVYAAFCASSKGNKAVQNPSIKPDCYWGMPMLLCFYTDAQRNGRCGGNL